MKNLPISRWRFIGSVVVSLIAVSIPVEPLGAQESTAAASSADAAPADFLGPLGWLPDDEQLGLSPEVRARLSMLAKKRQAAGVAYFQGKDLGDMQVRRQRDDWIAEGLQQARKLMSLEQRDRLQQQIIAHQGMASLAEPAVAQLLSLDARQRASVEELLAQQRDLTSRSSLQARMRARNCERRLQALLTAQQWNRWQQLAGLAPAPALADGPPMVSPDALEEETENDEEAAPGAEETAAEKADAEKAAADKTADEEAVADNSAAQEIASAEDTASAVRTPRSLPSPKRLRFAFDATPWRVVLEWLAREADLSLYVGALPTGTLTYDDKQDYTTDQAIERINRFLIPVGYTLIRSGKMISVIGLEDGRRDQLLDALAEYCAVSDLDARGDHEVVKCVFSLAKADSNDAMNEVRGLAKLSVPILLPKSKQIIVVETGSKLRMIRDALQALENPSLEQGPVRRFALEHISARDLLTALRPLVGIDSMESNIGADISLSVGADGKELLATGSAERLTIVASVVEMLDRPENEAGAGETPELRSHPVPNGNLQTVDNVLQTLLADEDVRLAQDAKTSSIVLLAGPSIHKRVETAIAQLKGEATVFDVVQLKQVEPFIALSVVREMLDIPFFDDEEEEENHPRLDYDSATMRVFVRGTQSQVDEVRTILEKLEQPKEEKRGPLRLLPIRGARAEQLLGTAKRFWAGGEEVQVFPSVGDQPENEVLEVEINGTRPPRPPSVPRSLPTPRPRTGASIGPFPMPGRSSQPFDPAAVGWQGEATGIRAQVTPRGILMQSDDPELLDRFEEHLRQIAGPGELARRKMVIFYLKHVHAEEAKRMLADVRRGSSSSPYSSADDEDDPLATESRPGRSRFSFSTPSIIADARLNRLVVQGTVAELLEIEGHLRIIDRDRSIAEIQVRGKPRMIQLVHIRAADAAALIREAYVGQLATGSVAPQPQGNPQQQQQAQLQALQVQQLQLQQQQLEQQQRGDGDEGGRAAGPQKGDSQDAAPASQRPSRNRTPATAPAAAAASQGQQSRSQEPKLALAVNESGNCLIIRAPDPLFQEVSELVRLIDVSATQATEVISVPGLNPDYVRGALEELIGRPRSSPPSRPAPAPRPTPQPTPAPMPIQVIRTFGG